MTIRYTCEGCGSSLKIEDRRADTEGHCPKCGAAFTVPQPRSAKRLAIVHADANLADSADDLATSGLPESDEDIAAALVSEEPAAASEDQRPRDPTGHIRYTCTACGSRLTIRPDKAGRPGHCPKCRARFIVPADGESHAERAGAESQSTGASDGSDEPGDRPLVHRPHRKSDTPQPVAAATIASALLKRNAQSDAELGSSSLYEPRRKPKDEEGIDWAATAKYFCRTALPALAGTAVACVALYSLASAVIKGSPERPPLASVTGTVTLDGEPLSGAIVTFLPSADMVDGVRTAESVGRTDPSGRYTLIYVQDLEGAVVGEHSVYIKVVDAGTAGSLTRLDRSESVRTVNVQSGRNTFDFPLKSAP